MNKKFFSAILVAVSLVVGPVFAKDLAVYPAELAVNVDNAGNMSIRSFPRPNCRDNCSMLPIYVYDGDQPYKSNCDVGCIGPWSPVLVSGDERQLALGGDWTAIPRADGSFQWAYRGRPIYTYYGDRGNQINGDGAENGKWHYVDLNETGQVVIYTATKN